MFGSIVLSVLSISPTKLTAQPIPFVCDLRFDSGRETTWVFEIDIEQGSSDIGDNVAIQIRENSASISWESLSCRAHRQGVANNPVCMNNFMNINRQTLRSNGAIEGFFYSGICRIERLDRQF